MRPSSLCLAARLASASLVTLVALSVATTVRADAPEPGPVVTLSGFADNSLSYRFAPKELAREGLVLGLDQVELDVDVTVPGGVRLRMDFELFPAEGIDTTDGAVAVFDRIVEQGYGEWTIGDSGFFLRAGKWNAPIGFEVIDPTGLWQWSYGLLFTYATPANLTGFAAGFARGATQVQLWVSNDWDQPATAKAASIGLRLQRGLGILGKVGTIGISATYGPVAYSQPKLMLDVDLALTFGKLRVGGQINYGNQGDDASYGGLLSLNYAFTDSFSLTLRGDYLDRAIPASFYKGGSLTLAGLFNLTKGFDLIAELRGDFPKDEDTITTGALELLASF